MTRILLWQWGICPCAHEEDHNALSGYVYVVLDLALHCTHDDEVDRFAIHSHDRGPTDLHACVAEGPTSSADLALRDCQVRYVAGSIRAMTSVDPEGGTKDLGRAS